MRDATEPVGSSRPRRPFLGILFRCCRVYARIYRDADEQAYSGGCPRCGRQISVAIVPGGSSQRLFEAG